MVTRVLYLSTPEFGVPTLRLLVADERFELVGVITQPDSPAGRGLKPTPPPVKVAALDLGLRVLQPPSLRTREVQAAIQALEPDVGAVAAYGQWIPAEVFDLPPKRSLNLHPSLLPRHRGAAPVLSAILDGDEEVGLSVLFVEDEMDAGDLLAQMTVPIGEDDTTGSLMEKLAVVGAPFYVEALAGYVAGKIIPQPQDHSKATWINRLSKAEGLIDWKLPAVEIARRCRAFSPWPGAFTSFNGRHLRVHRARAVAADRDVPPDVELGKVLRVAGQIVVVTGEGWLKLEQVQLEGRRQLAIHDFIQGQRGFAGSVLGLLAG